MTFAIGTEYARPRQSWLIPDAMISAGEEIDLPRGSVSVKMPGIPQNQPPNLQRKKNDDRVHFETPTDEQRLNNLPLNGRART